MSDLPEKIVRFDAVRIEYGKRKMCQCYSPHYEIDYQNKMVYCLDCGAIVDPLEALMRIAKDTKRWDDYTQEMLEQRRQIMSYQPRRVVIKKLEKQYAKNDRVNLEPTCPMCGRAFELEELLNTPWVHREFAKLKEAEHEREEGPEET